MVTIFAGEEEKPYKIQRTLLTDASEVLEAEIVEGGNDTLSFPDTDPRVIEYFLYFLLRGNAPLNAASETGDHDYLNQLLAIRIWEFGDDWFLPKLQNQAMRHLTSTFRRETYPAIATVKESLECTKPESEMCMFMMSQLMSGLHRRARQRESDQRKGTKSTKVGYGINRSTST